ncbi:DUF3618 domain-containing protein [Streptomyces sp. NPDC055109]
MGTEPDELRRDVEDSRAHLARNVELLADRVVPGRVARRKVDSAHNRLNGIRERVMGTAHDGSAAAADAAHGVADRTGQAAGHVGDAVSSTTSSVSDAARQTPQHIKQQTQGSPLAAGVIAFGAGMLAAALLPTSAVEEQVGGRLREHADDVIEPIKQSALEAGQEIRDEMREPTTQAVQSVKSTAADAAQTTADDARKTGRETAEQLRSTAQDGVDEARQGSHGTA